MKCQGDNQLYFRAIYSYYSVGILTALIKNNKGFGKSSSVDLVTLANEEYDFSGHILVEAITLPVLSEHFRSNQR